MHTTYEPNRHRPRSVGAGYDSYQVLSSGTAGFAESLIRDERRRARISPLAVRGAA